jgi:hypothetical protein
MAILRCNQDIKAGSPAYADQRPHHRDPRAIMRSSPCSAISNSGSVASCHEVASRSALDKLVM